MRFLPILPCVLLGSVALADPPTAAQQLAPLSQFFQGNWKCAGHFASGKLISSHKTFDLILGGTVLRETHTDDPPFAYDADSEFNLDRSSDTLLLAIHDSSGALRLFSAKDWRSGPMVFEKLPVLGNLGHQERFIYTRKPDGSFSFEYQMLNAAGSWAMGDTLDCVKTPD